MTSCAEFKARRQKISKSLPVDSIAIIPGAHEQLRNGDAMYRFRQDSDFYYLTGFEEPDATLIITTDNQSILFHRACNFAEEQWTGKRLGQEKALSTLGVDCAFPFEQLDSILPELLANKKTIVYPMHQNHTFAHRITSAWNTVRKKARQGISAPEACFDLGVLTHEMRLIKSEAEIDQLRTGARISISAHQKAMQAAPKAQFEYEIEAAFLNELTRQGVRNVAYDSIVAGGNNACILHYTQNNARLKKGDLVLMDAGGEYQCYAADITRTFPLNGHFSPEQKAIYDIVFNAQKAAISCIRPGCSFDKIQATAVEIITRGLKEIGLLRGEISQLIQENAYQRFYMHRASHWLGLDVHDVGAYKPNGAWRTLEPGMVLTVEPGIYIHESLTDIDKRFLGIGVRIEDDICVTQSGHENLTAGLATELTDIEALVRG